MTALDDGGRDVVTRAFLNDLAQIHSDRAIDLVLFSGDLAFSGKPEEYVRAQQELLEPLMELLGYGSDRVVIAPGNHDIDRDLIDPALEMGLLTMLDSVEAVENQFTNEERLKSYLERLKAFNDFRAGFYGNSLQPLAAGLATTHVVELDGISVGVAALNTAWRATGQPNDGDEGQLLLGTPQLNTAFRAIEDARMRIAVMHHPLDWLRKFDGDEARFDLDRNFHLLLTGHLHVADPEQVVSTRGTSIHSRTGSLYEDSQYPNAYSLIDIDLDDGSAAIALRSYWPDRREYDVATHIIKDGHLELPIKLSLDAAPLPAVHAPYSSVRRSLVDVAEETSVLADQVTNGVQRDHVADMLVPPRIFPMPYEEWLVANEPGKERISRLDLVELLQEHQCIVLAGGPETGLTSALLWALDRHFETDPARLPVHVRFEDVGPGIDPLDRAIRKSLSRVTNLQPDDDLPPLVIAVDDVDSGNTKTFRRILSHMSSHPDQRYLIACEPDRAQAILDALENADISATRGYLAPFGRRELKVLVEKIVGTRDSDLVDRVLKFLGRVKMPRTPFLMAALVVVLVEAEEFARGESTGETAVLNSYAALMLGTNASSSRAGLDERNFEHILSCLAEKLVTDGARSIARIDAEEFLVEYWKNKGWKDSPARVLDSLIERRVLAETDQTIRFRHPSLLFLFAAKRLRESAPFRELVEADPTGHSVTFQHAAALDRSDVRLLELADGALEEVLGAMEGLDASLFDRVTFLEDWAFAPDLQAAARVLGLPPVPENVIDRQIDDAYEVMEDPDYELDTPPNDQDESPLERIGGATALLSNVLRSSELIDDVELKTTTLKNAIDGWSVLAVALAMEEARTHTVRDLIVEIFEEVFPDVADKTLTARAEQITRVFMSHMVGFEALSSLGTVKMLDMLKALLDDPTWVASTPHALFTTFVYFNLKGADRTKYLAQLLKAHGGHPLVRALVRHTALNAYHTTAFGQSETTALENVLVDCTLLDHPREGVQETSRARSMILGELRKGRQLNRGKGTDESLELAEEAEDAD